MQPSRVAIIGADWPEYELFCPHFSGMQIGLSTLGIDHKLFSCRPVLNTQDVIAYNPDLVIYALIDMVRVPEKRLEIRRALPDARIVLWYGDLRKAQPFADLSEIDAMFVSNDAQSDFYKKVWKVPECHFLPLGSPIYSASHTERLARDFVFVGALNTGELYGHRAEMMVRFKEAGLLVVNADAQKQPRRRAQIMKDLPALYRSARIALDVSHFTDIQGYTSNRFWVISASCGFPLTKRWPGCEAFFPEGTRVYFDTVEEALELKEFYLNNTAERARIQLAGYARAKYHTYDHRFESMFQRLYGTPHQSTTPGISE